MAYLAVDKYNNSEHIFRNIPKRFADIFIELPIEYFRTKRHDYSKYNPTDGDNIYFAWKDSEKTVDQFDILDMDDEEIVKKVTLNKYKDFEQWDDARDVNEFLEDDHSTKMSLPEGSIFKLTGKQLKLEDEPIELV